MNAWQLFAEALAFVLMLFAGLMLWRLRLVSTLVMAALTVGLPAAGFLEYVIAPGPPPDETYVVALAVVLYASVLLSLPFAIRRRRRARSVYELASETRLSPRVLIGRLAMVMWLTAMLLVFHMAVFAVVNLVANIIWTVVWIPRRMRFIASGANIDIGAPSERVFEFMTDLGNWSRYRDDVELVSVTPPGRLANGTEYVVRNPMPEELKRAGRYRQMESRYRVYDVIAGRSYSATLEDGRVRTSTTMEPSAAGSRVTRRIEMRFPFDQATQGAMITAWSTIPSRRALETKLLTRVKKLLETPGD